MTLSDLASIGSLVSGMAVLVSLAYLSLQARHNNAALHRAENNESQNQASMFRLSIAENRDVAQLWLLGLRDDSELDGVDEFRFENLLSEIFFNTFNLWDRARSGLLGNASAINWLLALAPFLTTKRGARWYENNKGFCDPDYARAADTAIGEFRTAAVKAT